MGDCAQTAVVYRYALSIVVPVYNGEKTVASLVDTLAALPIDGGLQIVLVNDSSPDNSLAVCRALCEKNHVALTVVNLQRNFGEHNAVMAGYAHAEGEYIINMDDDLQNPPEEVINLWRYTKDNDFDVVYTRYDKKEHAAWRNLGSWLTNKCADIVIDKPKGLYLSSFRCLHARVARAVIQYTGPFPYIDGLIFQVTQNVGSLVVQHYARAEGQSNYTIKKLVRLFLSMLLNFSVIPLRIGAVVGVLLALVGMLILGWVVIEALFLDTPRGWASMMAVFVTVAGFQLMMLGIIGEYLGRLFLTNNQKPQFVVRDVQYSARAQSSQD